MEKNIVDKILGETEAGYDLMAEKFSGTRNFFWPDLEFIKDHVQDGDKILDFGCGNGRLLEIFKDKKIEYYGADISQKLIGLAKERYLQFSQNFIKISGSRTKATNKNLNEFVGKDSLKEGYSKGENSQRLVRDKQASLPFPDNFFNNIVSVAVFHHFPDKKFRSDMAKELYRVTKPGGEIIITVWNLWPASRRPVSSRQEILSRRGGRAVVSASRGGQPKYYKNIIKNWAKKIVGKSKLDWNDCYIPFKNNKREVFQRFHHAYTQKELKEIFSQAGFEISEVKVVNNKNLVLIGKK